MPVLTPPSKFYGNKSISGLARGKSVWAPKNADICNPRIYGTEGKVVLLVCLADLLPMVNHPSELYRGEVSGEWEAGPVFDLIAIINHPTKLR
jgi:hypothetical protein